MSLEAMTILQGMAVTMPVTRSEVHMVGQTIRSGSLRLKLRSGAGSMGACNPARQATTEIRAIRIKATTFHTSSMETIASIVPVAPMQID